MTRFQLSLVWLTLVGSRKHIIKLADIAGFDETRTLRVVRKARVWIIMAIVFLVPFILWFCLFMTTFWQWEHVPFVTVTGEPFDTHFHWLWYNLTGNQAFGTVIFGAFILSALLKLEWICWNKFSWERYLNRAEYLNTDRYLTD